MLGVLDVRVLLYALAGGVIPTLVWLWFWLREDAKRPEPYGLLLFSFIGGALTVVLVLPIEEAIYSLTGIGIGIFTILIASTEEIVKTLVTAAITFHTRFLDEPVDYAVYLVTGALGFAAAENTLYLLDPLLDNNIALTIVTGNLRFLGATVLHAVCAAIIGITVGIAFYASRFSKVIHFIFGLVLAIGLHALFNFFIMKQSGHSLISTFAVLWVTGAIVILLFEKLKYLKPHSLHE